MTRKPRTMKKPAAKGPAKAFNVAKNSAMKAIDAGMDAATSVRQSAVGAFEALVKQGAKIESATRKSAVATFRKTRREALGAATGARDAALARAGEAKAKTVEAVTHLERVFEQRVSKAISKLGVPTTKDVRALSRQVAQLQVSVDKLRRSRARARAA